MGDAARPTLGQRKKVGGDGSPEVFCANEQDDVPLDLARWQRLAVDVLVAQGIRGLAELSLLFITRDEITALNEEYMGATGATDVLAFPLDAADADIILHSPPPSRGPDRSPPDQADMPLLLGDVVICPAVAAEQAPSHAGTLDDELALLTVHGILHVLGHDHADPEQAATMRAEEVRMLEAFHWHGTPPADFRQEHLT